ncbi:hypothetical protein JCM10908_006362 [Rhodotorula pacifica]|uniref:uncharacterized protein n=1 Tax=Rhodotorula pacifica TaxID=1495444 RepID=UPI00317375EF
MLLRLLRQLVERNKLFFRDGVSEGHFSHILAGKVKVIWMAAAQVGQATGYANNLKLTFICWGRRHHISMFPSNLRSADVETGNAKSGNE